MIELSQGRSVKWQHNGAWFTGSVMNCAGNESLLDEDTCLVRHSNTSSLFVVYASDLEPNDFRNAEKLAESEAANELP